MKRGTRRNRMLGYAALAVLAAVLVYGVCCFIFLGQSELTVINNGEREVVQLRIDLGSSEAKVGEIITLAPGQRRTFVFSPERDGCYRVRYANRDGQEKAVSWGYVTQGAGEYTEWYLDADLTEVRLKNAAQNHFMPWRWGCREWRDGLLLADFTN